MRYDYVLRADGNNHEKDIMVKERSKGRSRRRWIQDVSDWSDLGINETVRLTQDREKWRQCVHHVVGGVRSSGRQINWAKVKWATHQLGDNQVGESVNWATLSQFILSCLLLIRDSPLTLNLNKQRVTALVYCNFKR